MNRHIRSSQLAAIICLVSPIPKAAAEETRDNAERDVETIIVTGTRARQPVTLNQSSGSITVLDEETIESRQTRIISDVLRDAPGVAVAGVAGQTQIRLRGAEANQTLVLIDGIEVSDSFSGEFDFSTLPADLGARVEVLRGQQSAIYGSDAIGGVIHYLTASGHEAPGVAARVEGGSFGTINGAVRAAGVTGGLDLALTAVRNSTDGAPDARGGVRDLSKEDTAISLKSSAALAENLRVKTVARYSRTSGDFNLSDQNPANPTFGLQVDTPGSRYEGEAFYALAGVEADTLDGRWSHAVTAQFADVSRDTFSSSGRIFGSEGDRLKASYETSYQLHQGEFQHILTFATDLERERYRNTDPSGFAFTGRRQTRNLGLVGQYDLLFGDRAHLGAAIRRDFNDRFADSTTYRIQASYRLPLELKLHAAAGSGVKNPGFYELFGFVDGRFIGNSGLKPEKSKGWEAGIERQINSKYIFGLTYFRSRLTDEIFVQFPPPNFVATPSNRDTLSRQQGIEMTLGLQPAKNWRVDAAYTYLDAKEEGIREVRRPEHSASLSIGWRAPGDRGGANLVARYVGNSTDLAFTDPSFVPAPVNLDDYLLLNLNVDMAIGEKLSIFGRVENALDEKYEQVFSFVSPGRAVFAGLRARI